jgi:hypothetical protein
MQQEYTYATIGTAVFGGLVGFGILRGVFQRLRLFFVFRQSCGASSALDERLHDGVVGGIDVDLVVEQAEGSSK